MRKSRNICLDRSCIKWLNLEADSNGFVLFIIIILGKYDQTLQQDQSWALLNLIKMIYWQIEIKLYACMFSYKCFHCLAQCVCGLGNCKMVQCFFGDKEQTMLWSWHFLWAWQLVVVVSKQKKKHMLTLCCLCCKGGMNPEPKDWENPCSLPAEAGC